MPISATSYIPKATNLLEPNKMKTYKFKLYNQRCNRHLHRYIDISASIYNHCIALHKRYYRLYKKSLHQYALSRHLTKLKKLDRYAYWNDLNSQAIGDICKRIDLGYKLFFRNLKAGVKAAPPGFKKRYNYSSFTLRQTGYKFEHNNGLPPGNETNSLPNVGHIKIIDRVYRYFKSRDFESNIKLVTVKRDSLGDIYIYVVTDAVDTIFQTAAPKLITAVGQSSAANQNIPASAPTAISQPTLTGPNIVSSAINPKIIAYDFGLKTFLTASDGHDIESPLFFKRSAKAVKIAGKQLSSKKRYSGNQPDKDEISTGKSETKTDTSNRPTESTGNRPTKNNRRKPRAYRKPSGNRIRARLNLARKYKKIVNQRTDFHWKTANHITDTYDIIIFEDLNLKGMQKLYGRKIGDLGFYGFIQIIKYAAEKKGKRIIFIDRFYPSSKTCNHCGHIKADLELRDRVWCCDACNIIHDRDRNAAMNILDQGLRILTGEAPAKSKKTNKNEPVTTTKPVTKKKEAKPLTDKIAAS